MRYFFVILAFFSQLAFFANAEELQIEDKVSYQVKVAYRKQDKMKGLMFVRHLPLNQGMFFDFKDMQNIAMWMKNTYIPLDMIFIDCLYRVSDIYENAEPLSLKKITSSSDFCYVLEINAGEVSNHNIAIGDKVFLIQ